MSTPVMPWDQDPDAPWDSDPDAPAPHQPSANDAAFWGGAQAADPRTSAGAAMTGEDVQRGATTAAGLGAAYAIPAAITAAVPVAAAYPAATLAVSGGLEAALEGKGWRGILGQALMGGTLGKVLKLHRALKGAGIAREAASEAAPVVTSAAKAAAPAAVSAEEALVAKALKQYPQLDPALVRQSIMGGETAAAPAVSAAPAAASKAEAAAKLEALLGNAVNEGRIAAAGKEAAKGNRQLAEKILGDLQGKGVLAP